METIFFLKKKKQSPKSFDSLVIKDTFDVKIQKYKVNK